MSVSTTHFPDRRAGRLLLGCLALSLLGSAAYAAPKRAFSIEDLYRVAKPSHARLSPDGGTLVYQLSRTDLPRGKSNSDLFRVAADGGEVTRLTWTEESSESSPEISPDGKWISFIAQRGEQEDEQIWLLPTAGGEARALTKISTGVSAPLWSPDGKSIAFASRVFAECGADDACNAKKQKAIDDGPLSAHVADELLYRHWNSWSQGKVQHVLLVEVESGEVRDLTPGEADAPVFSLGGPTGYAFSPDGTELCFTRNPDARPSLAWSTNSDLWVVPIEADAEGETRPARNLTASNPAWDGSPLYSPDGKSIAYRRQTRPGYESDRFELMLLDRKTGRSTQVTADFDNWVEEFAWLPDGRGLVFSAPFEGRTPLYRVMLGGKAIEKLVDFAYLDGFVLSPDAGHAYVSRRSTGEPNELWRVSLSGSSDPARLTTHNLALQEEVDIRPAESMWVEGAEGQRIQIFLVKPHGFDPARRYPLILNVHGGPQGMWADAFRGDWQVYPGAGYIVAFANPRGSTGYGQEMTAQISGDWGGAVFDDLMRVTDALEALPYVDGERIGAMGWSYGGYMMNWFQGHTTRFKALANMMGLFDLRSFYYSTEELWFPEWDLGGVPWRSDLYERWNPAASVGNFKTPMLIVTGEKDFRVPYTQGLMAFTALRRQGVPARLVVLPGAGHWPGWYEMALYYTAHLDWFQRYLGGAAPPWSVEDFANNAVFDSEKGTRIDK